MNDSHRQREIIRVKAAIGIKLAEYSHDQRYGLAMRYPERYVTTGLQRKLNKLLGKEQHA